MGQRTTLKAGAMLESESGRFQARMQGDGNFVVYDNGDPIWASETMGSGGVRITLQGDQHLVMYNQIEGGDPVWATNVYDKGGSPCSLVMQDDGNLVQYNAYDTPMWCTRTDGPQRSPCSGPGEPLDCDCYDDGDGPLRRHPRMGEGTILHMGGQLVSDNGEFRAIMQHDGNFVVYQGEGDDEPLWASNTHGQGGKMVVLQEDQHLVMYNAVEGGDPIWATNVYNKGGSPCHLVMQDDGNLVQYNCDQEPMWCTRTDGPQRSPCSGEGERLM